MAIIRGETKKFLWSHIKIFYRYGRQTENGIHLSGAERSFERAWYGLDRGTKLNLSVPGFVPQPQIEIQIVIEQDAVWTRKT
ncbi:hypothetical protein [Candidatus Thiosymbion oneisti]|uniref:hypothetical protein n=1 Tax=Candidatus Thiosymbion oneisti TaxID=589554 RepID=UPI0013FD18E9|nr:hypothetical protein [Candidatus Thiosymbion oneisti]